MQLVDTENISINVWIYDVEELELILIHISYKLVSVSHCVSFNSRSNYEWGKCQLRTLQSSEQTIIIIKTFSTNTETVTIQVQFQVSSVATKPKLFRVMLTTDERSSRHFVKIFQTRNPLLENWNSSCKYFRHSSQSTSDETQRSIQDQENSQHHPGSKNHQTQPSIFNARSSKWYLNQERIHQRSL